MEDQLELPTNPNSLTTQTNLSVKENDDDPPTMSSHAMDILVQAIDQFIDEDVQVIILVSISWNGFVCQITFFLVSNKEKVNFIEWNISTMELAKSTWRR